jgi:hypothetical protein
MSMPKLISILLITMATFTGCSHAPASKPNPDSVAQNSNGTSVEIRYILRHTDRNLKLEADQNGIHGQSLVDGSQLKQCEIDALRYQNFVTKVRNFLTERRSLASVSPVEKSVDCRAPYTITLKNQKDTIQFQGCRTQDEGAFSHLVQEGEFLIYRQK